MLSYTVKRAFARGGVYYTRANADAIRKLARADRDDLIAGGFITEHDDGKPADPAAPEDTKGQKGAK